MKIKNNKEKKINAVKSTPISKRIKGPTYILDALLTLAKRKTTSRALKLLIEEYHNNHRRNFKLTFSLAKLDPTFDLLAGGEFYDKIHRLISKCIDVKQGIQPAIIADDKRIYKSLDKELLTLLDVFYMNRERHKKSLAAKMRPQKLLENKELDIYRNLYVAAKKTEIHLFKSLMLALTPEISPENLL